jgi:hypothetical protein
MIKRQQMRWSGNTVQPSLAAREAVLLDTRVGVPDVARGSEDGSISLSLQDELA